MKKKRKKKGKPTPRKCCDCREVFLSRRPGSCGKCIEARAQRRQQRKIERTLPENTTTFKEKFSTYEEYLKTKWWRHRRYESFKLSNFRCSRCGVDSPLECHHKTYERIGCERDEDLEVLCQYCHRKEHGLSILIVESVPLD